MTILLEVIAVLLIVLANGFFVAAEYALVTARRSRLQELADNGMRRAKIAIRIMDSPVRFIGTVQLGITAFSILLGIVAEPLSSPTGSTGPCRTASRSSSRTPSSHTCT